MCLLIIFFIVEKVKITFVSGFGTPGDLSSIGSNYLLDFTGTWWCLLHPETMW